MLKTHTFRLGKYKINQASRIDGICDTPNKKGDMLEMTILSGDDFKALNSLIHEAMHAEGIPDKYLHDKEGFSDTERLAMAVWRAGYRKKKK